MGQPFVYDFGGFMQQDETISAIATPPGEGGIGIIRLSGENAVSIAKKYLGHFLQNLWMNMETERQSMAM